MKRPISQDFPGYDILLNPFSAYIEEGDFGIFLANSNENIKKIWKNQAIFEEKPILIDDHMKNLYNLLENPEIFVPKAITELKSHLYGHIVVKSSIDIFVPLVKVLRNHTDKPIVLANDYDGIEFHENQVFFLRTCWENHDEISKLSLEEADFVLIFSEDIEDQNITDAKNLKIIDFFEENHPSLNYIAYDFNSIIY